MNVTRKSARGQKRIGNHHPEVYVGGAIDPALSRWFSRRLTDVGLG